MSEQREREMALHTSKTDEKESEQGSERSTVMDYRQRCLTCDGFLECAQHGTLWHLGKQITLIKSLRSWKTANTKGTMGAYIRAVLGFIPSLVTL